MTFLWRLSKNACSIGKVHRINTSNHRNDDFCGVVADVDSSEYDDRPFSLVC